MAFWSLAAAGAGGTGGCPNCALSSATRQKANPACGPLSVRVPPMGIAAKSEGVAAVQCPLEDLVRIQVHPSVLVVWKTLGICATFVGISRLIAVVAVRCCSNLGVVNGLRNPRCIASITRRLVTPAGGAPTPELFELLPTVWAEDMDGLASAPAAVAAAPI